MATIKKLTNLIKALNDTTDEMLAAIVDNEQVNVEDLSDKQKLAILAFEQIRRGINTKDTTLIMDCNFVNSKRHNHEDEGEDEFLVDYWAVVPTANPTTRMIQVKVTKATMDPEMLVFKLHTSCKKVTREMLTAMEDDLKFHVKYDKNTGRAKVSTRMGVNYDELVEVIKAVCAVLAESSKKVAAEKAEAEKEKKPKKAKKVKEALEMLADAITEEDDVEEEAV